MKFTEPINRLEEELNGWKQARKNINEVLYDEHSEESEKVHRFYKNEIVKCDKMIQVYMSAIKKLKL